MVIINFFITQPFPEIRLCMEMESGLVAVYIRTDNRIYCKIPIYRRMNENSEKRGAHLIFTRRLKRIQEARCTFSNEVAPPDKLDSTTLYPTFRRGFKFSYKRILIYDDLRFSCLETSPTIFSHFWISRTKKVTINIF